MRIDPTAFADHLRSARFPRTAGTYQRIVDEFVEWEAERGDEGQPSTVAIEAFLARPRRDGLPRSPATRNQELAALRAFARFSHRRTGWTEDPTAGIAFLREPRRDPTVLVPSEVRRLFEAAAKSSGPDRARNLAMLAVLTQTGLRVHELVALDEGQVDLESRTLLGVHGKGATVSDLPLNQETVALLASWLEERSARALEVPALFLSSRGARITVRTVQRLLVRLRGAMGTKKKIVPHTLRHSAATIALLLGADLSTVGDLLRHADLNVTRRYLHLVGERTREAVRRLGTTVPASVLPRIDRQLQVSDESLVDRPPATQTPHISFLDGQEHLNEAPAGRFRPPEATTPAEFEASSPPQWRRAA